MIEKLLKKVDKKLEKKEAKIDDISLIPTLPIYVKEVAQVPSCNPNPALNKSENGVITAEEAEAAFKNGSSKYVWESCSES